MPITNNSPSFDNVAATAVYAENGGPVALSPFATVSDSDTPSLSHATISISAGTFVNGDVLGVVTSGTAITATYNSATGTLSLSGADTLAHYQQVLDSLTFSSTGHNPTNFGASTTRDITWQTSEGPTYQSQVLYPAGGDPTSIAVGDLNGDGSLDLAVANSSPASRSVSILLGDGHGAFSGQVQVSTISNAFSVAMVDLNGDGKLDLAVANGGNPGTVTILLGNGHGGFQPATQFSTGPGGANSSGTFLTSGDLNGDGHPDLVVANGLYSSTVSVLLGNGDGTVQAPVQFTTGSIP